MLLLNHNIRLSEYVRSQADGPAQGVARANERHQQRQQRGDARARVAALTVQPQPHYYVQVAVPRWEAAWQVNNEHLFYKYWIDFLRIVSISVQ